MPFWCCFVCRANILKSISFAATYSLYSDHCLISFLITGYLLPLVICLPIDIDTLTKCFDVSWSVKIIYKNFLSMLMNLIVLYNQYVWYMYLYAKLWIYLLIGLMFFIHSWDLYSKVNETMTYQKIAL